MTDEQRKALTLYLGEPWTLSYNMRSFTTDADMMSSCQRQKAAWK